MAMRCPTIDRRYVTEYVEPVLLPLRGIVDAEVRHCNSPVVSSVRGSVIICIMCEAEACALEFISSRGKGHLDYLKEQMVHVKPLQSSHHEF